MNATESKKIDLEEPSMRRWYTVEDYNEMGLDTDEVGELYNEKEEEDESGIQ